MYQKRVAETRGPSTPPSLVICWCVLLVAVLCAPMCAVAYNVRYTAFKSPSPVSARFSGYCPWHGGGHTMMPMKKSFQELAKSTIKDAAFKEAPIGGWCPYSSCTTQKCEWVFFTGLMNGTAVEKATFFKGTVYNGLKYTESIPGMYNNFLDGFQPVSFFKASGRTITKMVSDGHWENEIRDHGYTTWLCEFYEFTPSEVVTAPATDENGFVIPSKKLSPLPWWVGLVIGLSVLLILVVAIIIYCCCRKRREKEKLEVLNEGMQRGQSIRRVATQSQLAMSRRGSTMYGDADASGFFGMQGQEGQGAMGMGRHSSAYFENGYPGNAMGPNGGFYSDQSLQQEGYNPYAGPPPYNNY
ncbi:hypothetical protein TcG_05321 [Trypanosoma cruzi]|uniref:Uncharacterized protein n=2 Tax=Trypanosoma cruzi TaxID=5693 RepID=V5DS51_TRYCR|nr:hypothetical protein TCDM_01030 [Trypanosoma cruzi Dm28c]PBJ80358.1 hypothetical protein BCY84_01627 [Trypanosoma cruzi cruzi]PWU95388.1 hypothetical protein C4B63_22g32 [Trypanosoma cruzi]PBJ80361.1 hypothetical protein BCY84_01630 [Trypanosoma cruzi cruzi]PBJ80364.1 hypothetical protein BCY84_01633 [Trypanosoma cruzi cruzi]